jgi:hypothetical protein
VQEALAGLPGILRLEVVIETDRFDILYDANRTGPEAMLAEIRRLGYEPRVVHVDSEYRETLEHVDAAALPDDLRAALAEAARTGRPALFDVSGPG